MNKKFLLLCVLAEIILWPIAIGIYAVIVTIDSWLDAHSDELMVGAALMVAAIVLPRDREE